MISNVQKRTVYIVERHELHRTGFRLILEKDERLSVLGDATDLEKAMEDIRSSSPSVVIVGISEPVRDAYLCEVLKQSLPETQILVLFDDIDFSTINLFVAASVTGFSSRSVNIEVLLVAVHALSGGSMWFSPPAACAFVELMRNSVQDSSTAKVILTDREREILKRLVHGMTNRQIAEELQLSIETIKTYIRRIMDKSSIRNRRELKQQYRKRGLLLSSKEKPKGKTQRTPNVG